jgi:Mn2+/Fe2+ NRAMP family transporter
MSEKKHFNFLKIILPGLLVAATGVGAGDLATAGIVGSKFGVVLLWAVILGGIFKFFLTEGIARWQLATGTTFIEGIFKKTGKFWSLIFLPYLFLWTFFVGSALMSACGVTLHAIFPVFQNPSLGKLFFGVLSSIVGFNLVFFGGYKYFEKIMSISIGIMFVTVILTSLVLLPDINEFSTGIFFPSIPDTTDGVSWTLALIGGVGGTLTILCYGYWIKEVGRDSIRYTRIIRMDLAAGYFLTVLFGMAMLVIGSNIEISGNGADLLVNISDKLKFELGSFVKWMFLLGAFSAVFSSLLGVWQSVPYLFADVWYHIFGNGKKESHSGLTSSKAYKAYLIGISTIPMSGLLFNFAEIQKLYAVIGALFLPFLAVTLIFFNNKKNLTEKYKNKILTNIFLVITFIFFLATGIIKFFK